MRLHGTCLHTFSRWLAARKTVSICVCLVSFLAIGSAEDRGGYSVTTTLPTGITVSVDPDGSYTIATQAPSWSFAGSVGYRLTHITVTNVANPTHVRC